MVDRPVRWAVRHATRMFLLSPADRPVVDRLDGAAVPASIVPNGVAVPADVDPAVPIPSLGEAAP